MDSVISNHPVSRRTLLRFHFSTWIWFCAGLSLLILLNSIPHLDATFSHSKYGCCYSTLFGFPYYLCFDAQPGYELSWPNLIVDALFAVVTLLPFTTIIEWKSRTGPDRAAYVEALRRVSPAAGLRWLHRRTPRNFPVSLTTLSILAIALAMMACAFKPWTVFDGYGTGGNSYEIKASRSGAWIMLCYQMMLFLTVAGAVVGLSGTACELQWSWRKLRKLLPSIQLSTWVVIGLTICALIAVNLRNPLRNGSSDLGWPVSTSQFEYVSHLLFEQTDGLLIEFSKALYYLSVNVISALAAITAAAVLWQRIIAFSNETVIAPGRKLFWGSVGVILSILLHAAQIIVFLLCMAGHMV